MTNNCSKPLREDRRRTRSYAELFAGCGGMSLGIESAGFKRAFANELSPMPAATYAFNLIHNKRPESDNSESWFTRLYAPEKSGEYKSDPRDYINRPILDCVVAELKKFDGGIFVGSISQLNQALKKIPRELLHALNLDALSGGPPCQSFSLAGRRNRNDPRNDLPFEFATCAALLRPKVVIFENVSGILRPFKDIDGKRRHAWYEIAKAFYSQEYVPICTLAEAQQYGVPQRRPRFLMIALRQDIAQHAIGYLDKLPDAARLDWQSTRNALDKSVQHFKQLDNILESGPSEFDWIEPSDDEWPQMLLPLKRQSIDVECAIDGLAYSGSTKDRAYLDILSSAFNHVLDQDALNLSTEDEKKNRANRLHSNLVKARFRVLRLLAKHKNKAVGNNTLQELDQEDERWLMRQPLIFPKDRSDKPRKPANLSELRGLLRSLESKKHSQRSLIEGQIAPAQLSIPDDYAHYAQDRALTVREMARIQSFPDWFEFKGKVTTGGDQRAYEVPRYTQVGNAVPPLMGRQIAQGVMDFLNLIEENHA
ncbi:MAG: DNA cytosine methyltransferase [Gammaproteobacteria bacterium]